MQAPLRFRLPRGIPFTITQEIPESCDFRIPYATPMLTKWNGGYIFEQTVIQDGFSFSLLHFSVKARTEFTVEALQNFNTIQFTLKGETLCLLKGYGFLPLVDKTYTSMYIPEGKHKVWFDADDYIFLYIILDEDPLHGLSADYPHLQALITKLLTASTEGMMLERMMVDFSILRIIKDLQNVRLTGNALYLELQKIALRFLAAYNEHIGLKEQKGRFISPDEYANLIKVYVIDHVADSEKMKMSSLEKEFHVSKRTLERYFLKKFSQPLRTYIKNKRLERAQYMLLAETDSIAGIVDKLGYYDAAAFSKQFSKRFGYPPRQVKEKFFR